MTVPASVSSDERLRLDTRWRVNQFEFVRRFQDFEMCLVFPGDMHIADLSLGEGDPRALRVGVIIGHHFARVTVQIPIGLNFKRIEMMCGPDDFLPHRVERRRHSV